MTDPNFEKATPAMLKALQTAEKRERKNICPVRGVYAAAEDRLLQAMDERGLIEWDGEPWKSAPRISAAGSKLVARCHP